MQIADFANALATLDSAVAAAASPVERRPALLFPRPCQFRSRQLRAGGATTSMPRSSGQTDASRTASASLLWRYAAQVRGRHDARGALIRDIGNENLNEWPGPIAKFLMGRLPAGELEVAAESDDAAKKSNGKCMAAYLHRHGCGAPWRQATGPRAAPARPGALPDGIGGQLGGLERAEAVVGRVSLTQGEAIRLLPLIHGWSGLQSFGV